MVFNWYFPFILRHTVSFLFLTHCLKYETIGDNFSNMRYIFFYLNKKIQFLRQTEKNISVENL